MNTTFYHIYLAGNNYQDIFYRDSDFVHVINRLALAAYAKQTQILAYIFHQNHFHLVLRTADVSGFMHSFRMSLTHWFHRRYGIAGSVGMRRYGKYLIRDEGDMLDVIKYVLRNEVRHRLADDPFAARWSSIQCYFRESQCRKYLISLNKIKSFIPAERVFPSEYRMLQNGLIDPDSFVENRFVENLFGNRSAFMESIYAESAREVAIKAKLDEMRNTPIALPVERMADRDVLEYAHACVAERFAGKNILRLSSEEKYQLAYLIRIKYKCVSIRQLSRILSVPRSTLWGRLGGLAE